MHENQYDLLKKDYPGYIEDRKMSVQKKNYASLSRIIVLSLLRRIVIEFHHKKKIVLL